VLATPEWRGAIVVVVEHEFVSWGLRPVVERAPAWRIVKGSAEMFLRREQPARAPYSIRVHDAGGLVAFGAALTASNARDRLRKWCVGTPGAKGGQISRGEERRSFIWDAEAKRLWELH
jgi:hypothetical protein